MSSTRSTCAILSILVFTLLGTAGCSSVSSIQPIGEPVKDNLAEYFNGVWASDDGVVHCRAVGEGRLRIASVEWKDGDFRLNHMDILITEHNGARFMHLVQKTKSDAPVRYFFSRINASGKRHLVSFGPDIPAFAQAIEQNQLSGTVERKNKIITAKIDGPKKELEAFLTKERIGTLFIAGKPGVLSRVHEGKD